LIVKNEAHVIERALRSCEGLFDYWIVVDTGSTDGTQTLITRTLKEWPGRLIQSTWKGFSQSRNEALEAAKRSARYTLFIDADDVLTRSAGASLPLLQASAYYIWAFDGGIRHRRLLLVKNRIASHWRGEVHEQLLFCTDLNLTFESLNGFSLAYTHEGARGRDVQTYADDIRNLEQELQKKPADARSHFYSARTHHWLGNVNAARQSYSLVLNSKAADEEQRWLSSFELCRLDDVEGADADQLAARYAAVIQNRATRAEPVICLSRLLRESRRYYDALDVAQFAAGLTIPDDELFVDVACYGWKAWDEVSLSSFAVGNVHQAVEAAERALVSPYLPEVDCLRIRLNLLSFLKNPT
jgi:tetratricopeptide (TPR) repeat protein